MKRTISLLTVLAFVLAFSGSVFAQNATVGVAANVLSQITLGAPTNLDFGDLDPNSTPVIDPNGTNTDISSSTLGKIPVTSAESSTALVVDWNQTTVTLGDGSGNTMTYTPNVTANTTDDPSASSDVTKGTANTATTTSSTGELFIYIGGDLGTLSNQTSGSYTSANGSGDLVFTISYM